MRIDELLRCKLFPYTNAAIKIVSLQRGDTLYEYNARLLQPPASNQKIFTAAAALSMLGKDRPVTTSVAYDQNGSVYLKGCGDSLLSADDLAALAQRAATSLDPARQYRALADLSCFDDLYWGRGWMWDDEPDPDEMYITPLSVNGNAVTVRVAPALREGDVPVVTTFPAGESVRIDNRAVTGAAGARTSLSVTRLPGDRENLITITGTIPVGGRAVQNRLSLWKPERAALEVFVDAMRRRGITVAAAGTGPTPADATVIAQQERPLGEIVSFMMKRSDNLSAESVLKLLALQQTGQPGSAAAGGKAVANYLVAHRIPAERVVIADGSGVSRYNLTNADTIVAVLQEVYRDRAMYQAFYDSFPVAGRDGTLAGRMKGTAAEGNLRGKTGTMSGISALSGYLRTAEGEPLAFSIIVQSFPGSAREAREVEDRIGEMLCAWRR